MIKRVIDVCVAIVALVALFPLMALIALGIVATMGRPIFFRQRRPGRFGQPFELVKFRTMLSATTSVVDPRDDATRMTTLGKWLRATSLDELPELWNVLSGSMSLVGPRPLLMQYLSRYDSDQARRHELPPGLTGWAQINGRNATSWTERLAQDVWYVDNWSLGLDFRILSLTIGAVVTRRGVTHEGHATMPEFQGLREVPPNQHASGVVHGISERLGPE